MFFYSNHINTYFCPEMSLSIEDLYPYGSWSPMKPKLVMDRIEELGWSSFFPLLPFEPFQRKDFHIAHTEKYVNAFFNGEFPLATSNFLPWTPEFAETVKWTNASLYYAIRGAILKPQTITFSPTSGFHHAMPQQGSGYCTFSGQVIASRKVYDEFGFRGCYIDMDGHFGNSIEDSYSFDPVLKEAVPEWANINPDSDWEEVDYITSLNNSLKQLEDALLSGYINYVVQCSGADSLRDDDMGGQLSFEEWIKCKKMIYKTIQKCSIKLKKPIPLIISLFGGYRRDHYQSVIDAHVMDLTVALGTLTKLNLIFRPNYQKVEFRNLS